MRKFTLLMTASLSAALLSGCLDVSAPVEKKPAAVAATPKKAIKETPQQKCKREADQWVKDEKNWKFGKTADGSGVETKQDGIMMYMEVCMMEENGHMGK